VWTHTGLSFLPNIFTNLPLVHTLNPDFLGLQLWLCFSPGSWISSHETPELGLRQIPELVLTPPLVRGCSRAWSPNRVFIRFPNRQFSEVRAIVRWDSGLPHTCDSASLPNQDSRTQHIREFETSQVPGSRESRIPCSWKTYFKNFVKLNVSRVTGFPEFPNTSPSGKRVDSDDPIPRTFRKFSKKRHPRNVGGDTRRPGSQRRLNRGALRGTTPPRPYK
jgi:hypothetical protein